MAKTITVAGERLTEADQKLLAMATVYAKDGNGVFPGRGDHPHFYRLVRRGLLVFDDFGRDISGESDDEVPIYRLTLHGKGVAAALAAYKEEVARG